MYLRLSIILLLFLAGNFVPLTVSRAQDECLVQAEILGRSEFRGLTGIGEGLAENFALLGDIDGDGINDYAYNHPRDISTAEVYQYVVSYISGATNERLSFTVPYSRDDFTYGQNVGNIGDIDGDGRDEVFVSSHTSIYSNDGGEIYIISPLSRKVHYILKSGEDFDDRFGESVAALGDLNNDGISEIAVGARDAIGPCDPDKYDCYQYRSGSGVAYLYDGKTGNLLWLAGTVQRGEDTYFGMNVAYVGDVDGDGYGDFSVRGAVPGSPELFIFSGRKTALGVSENIISYIQLPDDYYQRNISALGDIDGDGLDEFLLAVEHVEEIGDEEKKTDEVNIMKNFGDGYVDSLYYLSKPREEDDFFGLGITMSAIGDINADGRPDFAVTDFESDEYGERHFYVDLYSGTNGKKISTIRGDEESNSYGRSIGYIGDIDGDGFGELLVSDPSDTSGIDWSNYDKNQTAFYNVIDYVPGLVHRVALSIDFNNNGIPEYCETRETQTPPTDGTPSTPSTPTVQVTFTDAISSIVENSYVAQKRGKKKKAERKQALSEIKQLLDQLTTLAANESSSFSTKTQKRVKRLFTKARKKKKIKFWNRFRQLLSRMLP